MKLLDVGAIAGTACTHCPAVCHNPLAELTVSPLADASEPWIDATSIDLNPQAPHVVKSNFFDFPVPSPEHEDELYDVVSLSLVMNFEGSLINRGSLSLLLS